MQIVRIEAAELEDPGLVEDHDVPNLQGDQVRRPERLQCSIHMDCREPERVAKLFLSDRDLAPRGMSARGLAHGAKAFRCSSQHLIGEKEAHGEFESECPGYCGAGTPSMSAP